MRVDPATAEEHVDHLGATYYFCSAGCRSKFELDPARYTAQVRQLEHAPHLSHLPVTAARPGGEMERHHSAIDPVCGMSVDPDQAESRSFQKGETYYFCSAGCKETFDKDPGKYIAGSRTQPARCPPSRYARPAACARAGGAFRRDDRRLLGHGAVSLTTSRAFRSDSCFRYSRLVSQTTTASKIVSPRSPSENAKVIR